MLEKKETNSEPGFDNLSYTPDFKLRPFQIRYRLAPRLFTKEVKEKLWEKEKTDKKIVSILNTNPARLTIAFEYHSLKFDAAPQDVINYAENINPEIKEKVSTLAESLEQRTNKRDSYKEERGAIRDRRIKFAEEEAFANFDGSHILIATTYKNRHWSFYDTDLCGLRFERIMREGSTHENQSRYADNFYLFLTENPIRYQQGNILKTNEGIVFGGPIQIEIDPRTKLKYVFPIHNIAYEIFKSQGLKPIIPVVTDLEWLARNEIKPPKDSIINPTFDEMGEIFAYKKVRIKELV